MKLAEKTRTTRKKKQKAFPRVPLFFRVFRGFSASGPGISRGKQEFSTEQNIAQIPVMENGRLRGLVKRDRLLELLLTRAALVEMRDHGIQTGAH
ncbi:MAG: hypothetical protein ACKV2V_05035 [Blastocatellia bacterium]